MFYVLVFSLLAVLLVIAGVMVFSRNRERLATEEAAEHSTTDAKRRQRKAQRAQSRHARRSRHQPLVGTATRVTTRSTSLRLTARVSSPTSSANGRRPRLRRRQRACASCTRGRASSCPPTEALSARCCPSSSSASVAASAPAS